MVSIDMNPADHLPDFEWVRPTAFVIYHPPRGKSRETILCNSGASQILSHPSPGRQKISTPCSHLSKLCLNWVGILDKNIETSGKGRDKMPDSFFLDLIKSGNRRYRVRGFPLYDQGMSTGQQNTCVMFTLERIHRDSINLQKIFRESKLSKREQDIIQLILADKSNKEIAGSIGLTLNTVKSYLKLLMRKIGVSSKAGIISWLLKPPSSSTP